MPRNPQSLGLGLAALLACSGNHLGPRPAPPRPFAPTATLAPFDPTQDLARRSLFECTADAPLAERFRTIELDDQPLHLGRASVTGAHNLFIFGAYWCAPCTEVLDRVPALLRAHDDLVVTYIDLGPQDNPAASAYYRRSTFKEIPYAYIADPCGLGIKWVAPGDGFKTRLEKTLAQWLPPSVDDPAARTDAPPVGGPVRYSFKSPTPLRSTAPVASLDHPKPPPVTPGAAGHRQGCAEWEILRISVDVPDGPADAPDGPAFPQIVARIDGAEHRSPILGPAREASWIVQPSLRISDRQSLFVLLTDHDADAPRTLTQHQFAGLAGATSEARHGPWRIEGRCTTATPEAAHRDDDRR